MLRRFVRSRRARHCARECVTGRRAAGGAPPGMAGTTVLHPAAPPPPTPRALYAGFGVGNMPDKPSVGWLSWLRGQRRAGLVIFLASQVSAPQPRSPAPYLGVTTLRLKRRPPLRQCSVGPLHPELYRSGSVALQLGCHGGPQMTPGARAHAPGGPAERVPPSPPASRPLLRVRCMPCHALRVCLGEDDASPGSPRPPAWHAAGGRAVTRAAPLSAVPPLPTPLLLPRSRLLAHALLFLSHTAMIHGWVLLAPGMPVPPLPLFLACPLDHRRLGLAAAPRRALSTAALTWAAA